MSVAMLTIGCIGGAIVQSTTGFGFGIVSMAFLPYMMDYLGATALAGLGAMVISASVAFKNWRKANLKIVLPLITAYAVTMAVSLKIAKKSSNETLTKALGIMLICMSIYFMFFNNKIRIKPTITNGLIAGALGGIGAGFFSIGGPPTVIYILSCTDDKEAYRANQLVYFTMTGIYSSGVRIVNGIVTKEVWIMFGISIVALLIGTYIGGVIFHRINANKLRKLIYGVMAVSGLTMLF